MYVSSSLRGSFTTKSNSPNFSREYGGNGYRFRFVKYLVYAPNNTSHSNHLSDATYLMHP
jgi:hypothetical protein